MYDCNLSLVVTLTDDHFFCLLPPRISPRILIGQLSGSQRLFGSSYCTYTQLQPLSATAPALPALVIRKNLRLFQFR